MTTLINIRGTNGSGKTTAIRSVMLEHTMLPWVLREGKKEHILGYVSQDLRIGIVGKYTTTCGGCDTIKTQDEIKQRILELKKILKPEGVILFEGVLVSTIFKPWYEFAKEHFGGMTWAYLDTPLGVCLSRIQERNGGKPIKEELVAQKIKTIGATRKKAVEAGEEVLDIDHHNVFSTVRSLVHGALYPQHDRSSGI